MEEVSKKEVEVDSVAEVSMDQLIHTKQWNLVAKTITTGNHDRSTEQEKQLDQLTLLLEQLDDAVDSISPHFLANVFDCIVKFLQEYRHDSTNISSLASSTFISFKQELTKLSQSQQQHIVQFVNTAIDAQYVNLSEVEQFQLDIQSCLQSTFHAIDSQYMNLSEDELQQDIQDCLLSTYENGKAITSSFWKLTDAKVDLRNLQESTEEIVRQNILEQGEKLKERFTYTIERANMDLLEVNSGISTKTLGTCPKVETSVTSTLENVDSMKKDESSSPREVRDTSFFIAEDEIKLMVDELVKYMVENNKEETYESEHEVDDHEVEDIIEYEYTPLPLHTKYQDHEWTNLPPIIQEAAGVIGLNQESWNSRAKIANPNEKCWYLLSHDEREAATTLGWDEDAWDHKYENNYWHELPKHVKFAAKCLGFERYTWNHDEWPREIGPWYWQDLTDGERCLLYVLGYSKHTWDEKEYNASSFESDGDDDEYTEGRSESEDDFSDYGSSTISTEDSSQYSFDEDDRWL